MYRAGGDDDGERVRLFLCLFTPLMSTPRQLDTGGGLSVSHSAV